MTSFYIFATYGQSAMLMSGMRFCNRESRESTRLRGAYGVACANGEGMATAGAGGASLFMLNLWACIDTGGGQFGSVGSGQLAVGRGSAAAWLISPAYLNGFAIRKRSSIFCPSWKSCFHVSTATSYWRMASSTVARISPSLIACAINTRSNGSLCFAGSLKTASACSCVMGSATSR